MQINVNDITVDKDRVGSGTIKVLASDGSMHQYPDGYKVIHDSRAPDWISIVDEDDKYVAGFFRPRWYVRI